MNLDVVAIEKGAFGSASTVVSSIFYTWKHTTLWNISIRSEHKYMCVRVNGVRVYVYLLNTFTWAECDTSISSRVAIPKVKEPSLAYYLS